MTPVTDIQITRRRALLGLALSPAFLGVRSANGLPQSSVGGQTAGVVGLKLPLKEGSVRFAVMGDTGRGDRGQLEMARQMETTHKLFPFDVMIMVGDNIYGADSPADMRNKFETPYKPLLDAGVKFQASIGNHDNPNQRFYKPFNMGDKRYYTFHPPRGSEVRFFAIDTNYVDKVQLDWIEKELSSSSSDWKIPFFHHPLYSSGRTHGSALETRAALEPLFVKYGVSAVFAGHDHFYERTKPQKGGIVHWVTGAGGSLRNGDIRSTEMTAKGFDSDYHFMIVEISGDEMFFQAISRTGATIDSGVIRKAGATPTVVAPLPAAPATPAHSPAPTSSVGPRTSPTVAI